MNRLIDKSSDCACSLVLAIVIVTSQMAGCGPGGPKIEYADVVGKVTHKGETLKMGTVSFQPAFGARAVGDIQPDGTYKLKGVVGPNTVTIASHEPGAEPGGPEAEKMMNSNPKSYIPMKYSSMSTSGLTFDVKANTTNSANFDLE